MHDQGKLIFTPDPYVRTVRIAVRHRNGAFEQSDGSPLPEIDEDAIGELILRAHCLPDEEQRERLLVEKRVPFISAGETVMVTLNPTSMERPHPSLVSSKQLGIPPLRLFAPVVLLEHLQLVLRGDKSPILYRCKCYLPLLDQQATSLNHAYTRLSTAFESKRQGHTGNAFRLVYARVGQFWQRLDEIRISAR